ncbi:cytochrome P450 [Kitasatospora sp. MAA4]|uniref:cytochrome P450 n=1 Tax=Kitasatospora sp. MAA4 TaxID=3035093 RepID=UPI0024762A69|nr:cytochrome P450 [Kitasatospora sp. MAA4]MDH6133394.1 cytochrome P450 [Kitasatospora sp. MAA4]
MTAPHPDCPAHAPGAIARHAAEDFTQRYAHLRKDHPVYHDPELDLWIVARHHDIDTVLRDRDHAFTPAHSYDPVQHISPAATRILTQVQDVPVTASTDPPLHSRYRDALTAVWPTSASQLAPWHAHIEKRATEAATALAEQPSRRAELHRDFVHPLTSRIMADLIGVDPEDEQIVTAGSAAMADLLWAFQQPADQQPSAHALADLWAYCVDLVAQRRSEPRDDLTTAWLDHRDPHGTPLTDAETASTLMEILTTNAEVLPLFITATLQHLLTSGDYQQLVHHPQEIPAAVEETLRHDPPLIGWLRSTVKPVTVGSTPIPAGARLLLLMHSAAQDETHKVREPHTFDHRRDDTPPTLNFGAGIHYCPGTQYSRLVAHHTIRALTQALPDLTLITHNPAPRPANLMLRRPTHLTVTW